MKINFYGYKGWMYTRKNLGLSFFYVLPTICIHEDNYLDDNLLEIKIAWLFWSIELTLRGEKI